MRSTLKIESDYREAARYLAINLSKEDIKKEGIGMWIPVRTGKRGAKPGIGGLEARSAKANVDGQWEFLTQMEPPEEIRRQIIGIEL